MRALSSLLVCEYLDIPADVYASRFYPPSCPKCRPLHPKQSFFTVFWRGGLHFGRHSPQTTYGAEGIALHEGATRRRHAVRRPRVVQTPTPPPASGTTAFNSEARTPRNSGPARHQLTMVRPNSEPPKARGHRRPRGNVLDTVRTPNGSTGGTTV